jgi:hypothetical protein
MAFFIAMFTMQNALLSTGIGPIGVEFAAAARTMGNKGASEIHEFAAMNFVFGKFDLAGSDLSADLVSAGSSLIGALVGGEVYASTQKGWAAVCWWVNQYRQSLALILNRIAFTVALLSTPIPLICAGERPLLSRLKTRMAGIGGAKGGGGSNTDPEAWGGEMLSLGNGDQ